MINNLFIFIIALLLVIRGATMATKHAARLAESFHLSKYTVGFIIVAVISILPETFIAISAAIEGIPSFGLATLLGSNVADLTLVFAVIIFFAGRDLKVESKILKNHFVYPFILLLPLVLGFNGHFSRLEGLTLIIAGGVFYYIALKNGSEAAIPSNRGGGRYKSFLMLLFSMAILLIGSHFTVTSATGLAGYLGINPILIGLLIVGLGTTVPELFFSLKSVKTQDDSLAVGDILGTVLADATIVIGILALINPFSFPQRIVWVTGVIMFLASLVLFACMRSGKTLTRKEGLFLVVFYIFFVFIEYILYTSL